MGVFFLNLQELEASLGKEEKSRQDVEKELAKIVRDKNDLYLQLQTEKDSVSASEEKIQKLLSQKVEMERQVNVKKF